MTLAEPAPAPAPAADLLVRGTIHPMDGTGRVLTAIAVRDGRFAGVDAAAEALVGPLTEIVEVPAGEAVVPGLGDIHTHLWMAGHAALYELAIDPLWSLDEVVNAVAAFAKDVPAGGWVLGGMWGIGLLAELSTVESLARFDAVTGEVPMLLRDETAHHRLANTAALRLMGIDPVDAREHAPDVVVDPATGAATGMLVESASRWVEETMERTVAHPADEEAATMRKSVELLNGLGITMTQEAATGLPALRGLTALEQAGELGAWVVTSASLNDLIFGFTPIGAELLDEHQAYASEHVRPTFTKIFLDGTPPTFTAFFHDPYPHAHDHGYPEDFRGTTTMDFATLLGWLRELRDRGLGVKIHCTGDASVTMALDAMEALEADGKGVIPLQIAHAQFVLESDYERLARYEAAIDICPQLWFPSPFQEGAVATAAPHRRDSMCCYRDELDAGARIVGGSDWPVSASPDPWPAIHGLVTRANPDGVYPGTYRADQALTVAEALAAFTIECARAMGIDDVAGSIEEGKSADFVVLSQDPFAVEPTALAATRALATYFAGRRR